jgi:non-ribosomal peptide synthetase component F/acyl carrier protein
MREKGAVFKLKNEKLSCDAPKGLIDAELQSQIRELKAAIIDILRQEEASALQLSRIEPIADKSVVALSLSQERFLFLENLVEAESALNLPAAFKMKGHVNVPAFEKALQEIVNRHEILRTSFHEENGIPVQKIHDQVQAELQLVNFDEKAARSVDDYTELMSNEAGAKFNLETPPVLSCKLIYLKEDESILFFVSHPLVWDGWSFDIFLYELDLLYRGQIENRSVALDELKVHYADYAVWHRQWIEGQEVSKQIQFWKNKLVDAGPLPKMNLPFDFDRPMETKYKGGQKKIAIPKEQAARLNELCARQNITLFTGFLSVLSILLSKYCNQSKILISMPMWNRVRPELENVIGHFVNTVLLITEVTPDSSFNELLKSIQADFIDVFSNQEAPFERLIEEFGLARGTSREPVYQVFFSYQDAKNRKDNIGDLSLKQIYVQNAGSHTDLTFWLKESVDLINGAIDFSAELFKPETVDRFYANFLILLDSCLDHPDQPIAQLSWLSDDERKLQSAWQNIDAGSSVHSRFSDRFREAASMAGNNTAVEIGSDSISYTLLDERTEAFAAFLRQSDISTNEIVGVCFERNIEAIIAMVALLKMNQTFFIFDLNNPVSLNRSYCSEIQVSKAICADNSKEAVGRIVSTVIAIDNKDDFNILDFGHEKIHRDDFGPAADNVILVQMTPDGKNGSERQDIQWRAIEAIVNDMQRNLAIDDKDTYMGTAQNDRVDMVMDVVIPLVCGSRLVLPMAAPYEDISQLLGEIIEKRPTILRSCSGYFQGLINTAWEGINELTLIHTGDSLSEQLAEGLLCRGKSLWNIFKPVEQALWYACHKVDDPKENNIFSSVTGASAIYIADDSMKPVPVGVYGNIYAAHGDEAAESRNEKANADSLCRTYYMGRICADGKLSVTGRSNPVAFNGDAQIDCKQIEDTMKTHASVANAHVKQVIDSFGNPIIVGYFQTMTGTIVTTSDLRKHLSSRMAPYQVPRFLLAVDRMSCSEDGTVDGEMLPPFIPAQSKHDNDILEPRNDTEELMASIWKSVLSVDKISIKDNFFNIGGHSLLCLQVVSKYYQETGIRIPPRTLLLNNLEQISETYPATQKAAQ